MKNIFLVVLLTAILVFSVFSVALAADICPSCGGTGKVIEKQPCPNCQGGTTKLPTIVLKKITTRGNDPLAQLAVLVSGVFHNEEDEGCFGTAVAEVKTSTETYTNTSSRTYFPSKEDITVTVIVEGPDYGQHPQCFIRLSEIENINCPDCAGTGIVLAEVTCPDCGGTGVLSASFGDFTNIEGAGGVVVGLAIVGAVLGASFFILKKKRVTEETLRRLSNFEFQDWVAKRLGSSSQSGSYLGIDGFTNEGYPFQVRQEDDVGRRAIDSFAAAAGRAKARSGTIVAFSFGRDALEGVTRARLNYGLEIKTVTVRELLIGQKRSF